MSHEIALFAKNFWKKNSAMIENLVIVESPAKAKTIEKFLGKNFQVKSSFGHIRDLKKKDSGIDIANNFKPSYEVQADKKKVVTELKKLAKEASTVWLASDEDREGEAIAWHLKEALKLDPSKTKRIVFHEITKDAIMHAVEHPKDIDQDLVNAQQARRILDRIVGFEVSPILWKKVKPSLSAGRVQSVTVKLIVEREREIQAFKSESNFRVIGHFTLVDENGKEQTIKAELDTRFKNEKAVQKFLEECRQSTYSIENVVKKPGKRSPAAPFTTSTLQQEASRKLGYSVSQTMAIAQRLYEAGFITYMRTDSVNLSKLALNAAKAEITSMAGAKYVKTRNYSTKSKGAQEAHEAIRPSYMDKHEIEGGNQEQRLYELIWKRAVASQMADAELEKTTATIKVSGSKQKFVASGEVITFDGFLRLYIESTDDEGETTQNGNESLLPPLEVGQALGSQSIVATERFSQRPPRYTEASLVRKLEELGIGRPSTYAPTISTIQNREYVVKEDRDGVERTYKEYSLADGEIASATKTEITGAEKKKLFPPDIGIVVNDFLDEHFKDIMDYNFTANIEVEFDNIASGKLQWTSALQDFYKDFQPAVEETVKNAERQVGERVLGTDPKSGKPLSVRLGRFGPIAQIGTQDDEEKPTFASLLKGQSIETITLEEALELFKLPRTLGDFEDKTVVIGIGRFGPYIRHNSKFVSIPKGEDPMEITLEEAIEKIKAKRIQEELNKLKTFEEEPELQILKGRFGPYISYKKKNYKIAKGTDPLSLSLEDCRKIIEETPEKPKRGGARKKKS